ncbi:PREDICTED: ras-related protein Rab-30-like isoform X1 [Ceratosolen solmsi marchali]|uniref:Ras-related protein Rab-30 n=1 Tax=Ceratosolen solmsi marchali TaxID=326594 RepID=A0AAJ6VLW2_9HYME|nr:PREDICTED: ras-related protein Rab-30-like isoform X1 [Ceratosolen solmsi marchali]
MKGLRTSIIQEKKRTEFVIMEDYKFLFKVVLVGNAGVGKTCLVRRFTQGLFPPGQGATIGVDFMIKTVEVENEIVKLQIWDTAGQERFRSITQSYYRSAHALILVYDISCQPTFDCLPDWLREIEEYASNKVLRILVGNKIDREDREIPTHVGEDFAQRHGMYFLETSAKEAENVERLFMEIAAELMEQARCKELPRYEQNTTSLNGKTTSIGDAGICGCSRLS